MEHQEIDNLQAVDTNKTGETKKKEPSMKARIQRNQHARKNWKIKLKRRKLEQMGANVEEEKDQMVPNVNKIVYRDFSFLKNLLERTAYSEEKEEKIKCLQEESKENPGSHPSNEVIVEENQRTISEFCKKENLVLPADEVGGESRRSSSISQEDLEELMTSVKKDPYLKSIIEDIETGGPTVMMRYLNDSEITKKLALAMGFGVLVGYSVNSVERNAPNADAEDQTAKQA
ncbi:hypothetical protein C5167_028965 [Papaver somniferum]|uniref:uncharacterized protein LOC113337271 n=1 Tax=Papaver somniferum TaxID=3469 RepID=UPI000E6FF6AD|nr:uncharacterized protein LOC113337271 [Papaver somniferum]RZC89898.1 hypothetical protein C5167_028965 [Papaver somniferum]